MNTEAITIQDCIENYEWKNNAVILKDGMVEGFRYEKEEYYAKASVQ